MFGMNLVIVCISTFNLLFILQISGHPRNNLMTDNSYLIVERLLRNNTWITIATDADWETKYLFTMIL